MRFKLFLLILTKILKTSTMKKTSIILFVVLVLIVGLSCTHKKTKTGGQRIIEQNSPEEEIFQDVLSRMEQIKSIVEKHDKVYELSLKNKGSLLSKSQTEKASSEVLTYSNELLSIATKASQNQTQIRQVSGAKENIEEYLKYANKMKEKHE